MNVTDQDGGDHLLSTSKGQVLAQVLSSSTREVKALLSIFFNFSKLCVCVYACVHACVRTRVCMYECSC